MFRKKICCLLISCTLVACLLLSGCSTEPATESTTSSSEMTNEASSEVAPAPATEAAPNPIEAVAVEPETAPTETDSASSEAEASEAVNENASDIKQITISIFNMCNADFGMFSVIDPATNEQINLGAVSHEEMLSFEAAWPIEITEFQWAIYNQNGELYMEGKTDITAANTDAALLFTGDGAVDSVEEKFK